MIARLSVILVFIAFFLNYAPFIITRAVISRSNSLQRRFDGRGTWFTPDTGACGDVNTSSDYIVAMNSAQYDNGSTCQRNVRITNTANKQVVQAKVTDLCPSCGYGSLDLSPAAFQAIGNLNSGVLPISWDWA